MEEQISMNSCSFLMVLLISVYRIPSLTTRVLFYRKPMPEKVILHKNSVFPFWTGCDRIKPQATSKNSFLVIPAENFVPEKVVETPECLVYCGASTTHLWGEKFDESPKGEFL